MATLVDVAHLTRVGRDGRVLEVGAGTGRTAIPLASEVAARVVALDSSVQMLFALKAKDHPANLDLVAATALEDLPLRAGSFDLVTCFGVVGHYPQWTPILPPLARMLRPGGRLIFNHRNARALAGFDEEPRRDKGTFDPAVLGADLAGAGLDLEAVYPVSFTINPLSRLWGLSGPRREDPVLRRRFHDLVDLILAAPAAVPAWAAWEFALGEIMPATASVRSIIVARRPDGQPGPAPHLVTTDDPEGLTARLADLVNDPSTSDQVSHPAVGAMLALVEPLIDRFTAGTRPFADRVPDYFVRRAEIEAAVARIGCKGPGARIGQGLNRAGAWGRRGYEAVRLRLGRLLPWS